jgi:hypothetical protein
MKRTHHSPDRHAPAKDNTELTNGGVDVLAWEVFLANLAAVRSQNLQGQQLRSELEHSWAHLFESVDRATASRIYLNIMATLMSGKIAPSDQPASTERP